MAGKTKYFSPQRRRRRVIHMLFTDANTNLRIMIKKVIHNQKFSLRLCGE